MNPVFIIKNWKGTSAMVNLNGTNLEEGVDFTSGIERSFNSQQLIIWTDRIIEKPSEFLIQPE